MSRWPGRGYAGRPERIYPEAVSSCERPKEVGLSRGLQRLYSVMSDENAIVRGLGALEFSPARLPLDVGRKVAIAASNRIP